LFSNDGFVKKVSGLVILKPMIWIVTESGKRKTGYKWARINNMCYCDEVINSRGNFGILQYVSKVRLIN